MVIKMSYVIIVEFNNGEITNKEFEMFMKLMNTYFDKGINFKTLKYGTLTNFDGD